MPLSSIIDAAAERQQYGSAIEICEALDTWGLAASPCSFARLLQAFLFHASRAFHKKHQNYTNEDDRFYDKKLLYLIDRFQARWQIGQHPHADLSLLLNQLIDLDLSHEAWCKDQ